MKDPIEELAKKLRQPDPSSNLRLRRAVVSAIDPLGRVTITLAGASVPWVPYLNSYAPTVDDVVEVLQSGPDLLVLGLQAPALPIAFRAHAAGVQSVNSSVFTQLTMSAIEYNQGDAWDNATDDFIAPVPGVYSFTGFAPWATNATGSRYLALAIDGTRQYGRSQHVANLGQQEVSIQNEFFVDAGQAVALMAYQNSGAALNTYNAAPDLAVTFAGHFIH